MDGVYYIALYTPPLRVVIHMIKKERMEDIMGQLPWERNASVRESKDDIDTIEDRSDYLRIQGQYPIFLILLFY
jgi:hypothetical protein